MPFHRRNLQVTKINWGATSKPDSPSSNAGIRTERSSTSESEYAYPEDAVAVIGASCRLPGADNLEQLWALLSTGQDRHEEIPKGRFDLYGGWRASQCGSFCKTRRFYGNFLDDSTIKQFDHTFFGINAREMANMDPQQRLLLEVSYEAMESCGYTRSHVRERNDPIGCFIGGSFVEYLDNTNAHPPTAYTSTGTIRAFLCGRLSYHFGWSGPAEVIDTACSSSLVAVNRAVKAVQRGECSMALAGGINLITGANNFLDLARAGFLSPTGQCKPFDKDADGYCRSEGAGLVVLKTLKQAQADGDHILAVITAAATNQGGLSCGIAVPEPNA
ncbi:beta-ketoacyl synthase [Aspergillus desertorum]